MKLKKKTLLIAVLSLILMSSLSSCFKNTEKEHEEAERLKIQDYLSNHTDLNFVKKESGLYFLETKTGTGDDVAVHDTVYMFYTAKFLNDVKIETNVGTRDTMIAPLGEDMLIKGLEEGLTYMKAGGKATFLIPSSLAYGPYGNYYTIPGYTPLLFDIALVKVKKGPGH